jgi:hypothetical protein
MHKPLTSSFPNPKAHGAKAKDIITICANLKASIEAIEGAIKRTQCEQRKRTLSVRKDKLISKFIGLGSLANDRTFAPDMIQRTRKHDHTMRKKEQKDKGISLFQHRGQWVIEANGLSYMFPTLLAAKNYMKWL